MLAIPIVIYTSGRIYTGTNQNVFSILAALGAIPAAKFIVDFIMICMQKSASSEIVELTEQNAGDLIRGYELVVTAYEGAMPLDSIVICGGQAAAFSTNGKTDLIEKMEKHISKILKDNGYVQVNVHVFQEKKAYVDRIRQLSADPEKYRNGIAFTPDTRYPDLTREECILHTIMAISL